ncbi:hypothetical protein ZIOFF_009943 [Zingiber officinale]|uniref:Uncharacterized protein n=1 Tax=Zingiber officinale TaxID=94328 RepID=A0A8J5HNU0_ZINOF|nr:hypothetical protein ZIOFF_009943 [Zingiber officinale]
MAAQGVPFNGLAYECVLGDDESGGVGKGGAEVRSLTSTLILHLRSRDGSRLGVTRSADSSPPRCSKNDSQLSDNRKNNKGERPSTDWDKAWSRFRKQGKKAMFSEFNPNKYVSWNPRRSHYPLSEEVDPIKRIERSNLKLWTSPKFTLVGATALVLMLLIYTLLASFK